MNREARAARKAQLIAQCDLDRMRMTHALLVARESTSPLALVRGASLAALGGPVLGFALPLLTRGRGRGLLRAAAFAVAAARAVARLLRR